MRQESFSISIIQNIDGKNYKKLPDEGKNLQEPWNESLHALAGSFPGMLRQMSSFA